MIRVINRKKLISICKSGMVFGLTVLLAVFLAVTSEAKGGGQKTFASAEDAAGALINAAKTNDTKVVLSLFGPGGKDLIVSDDKVIDRDLLERFVAAYDKRNRLEMNESETKAFLYVGEDEWPFPVPVVKKAGKWVFDVKEGKSEILRRRIGRNELGTVQACLAYVDAQKEYARRDYDRDGLFEYAQKFMSDPGKKNGLYWETKEGEEPSPLGLFVAKARKEGYGPKRTGSKPAPYQGYFYKIIKAQGNSAPGGAYNYLVKDKMIGGFALVAYPAQYGMSGIMTFIVNQDGIVYEKNLGKNTAKTAEAMKAFDPDNTWKKAQ
ncbi:MAG TPA: DUF2950 domain-containing protein [Syntrophorhabdaceae bacterium]|nr:DUF2950 domain-containing protein [Syntrophorhabdaceae bacterium]